MASRLQDVLRVRDAQQVSIPGQVLRLMLLGVIISLAVPESDAAAPLGPPPVPVVVGQLAGRDFPIEIEAVGHVATVRSARIRPQIAGQLLSTNFKKGELVKADQVLVRVDPHLLQPTVAQDYALLLQDRAVEQNAQAILSRSKLLLVKRLVSVQGIESQRAQVAGLSAKIAADQAGLQRDKVELGYTSIAAPFDGVAGLLLVSFGNIVKPE